MDLDLRPPEHPDRAASAEPSSTRPNPFDDGDISSRKRRRTSLSGSPATSLDTMDPIHESSSSTTLEGEPDTSNSPPPQDGRDPATPKTPEHRSTPANPPIEPSSSMVTINLRNAPKSDVDPSPPFSPSPSAKSVVPTSSVKASVEDQEVDTTSATHSLDTPQESSSSSGSPPIEIITVQSDEDMVSDHQEAEVSIVGEDVILIDPFQEFPYTDGDENPVETIRRLTQYFTTQSPVEESVLDNVQQWIEKYLNYIRDTDQQSALDSCHNNFTFWQAFPDIFVALECRKPHLLRTASLREVLLDLYAGFARLTAWLIVFDHYNIQESLSIEADSARQTIELLSPWCIQALHPLTRSRNKIDPTQDTDLLFSQLEVVPQVLKAFHSSQGGSIKSLQRLATGIVELIPTSPKLADSLTPICQLATDIMSESSYIINSQGSLAAKQRLEVGHQLHDLVSAAYMTMIEKHVSHLSSDSLTYGIQAMSDLLRLALPGNHQEAIDTLSEHRRSYPDLPHKHTAEAIVCEKRFNILSKLIRSSQMQLRVMGVTTMCSDLVACWKRYGDAGDESNTLYLNHLATYLLQTKLIEYILGPNCHPEITVESANIIGFLVVTKNYRQENTDSLWQGITSSQDPRVAEALTRMIGSIVNLFDYEGLLGLCVKLQTLPIEGFTREIRVLWESIIRHMVNRVGADRAILTFHPFDLCLRLLREASICGAGSQVAHPDMQHAVMQKLKELFQFGPDPDVRQQLYQSCIDDISKKSNTTLGSLWCLSMAIRPAVMAEVHLLTEKHNLTNLIVDELEHAIESGQLAGVPAVLYGVTNQPRRDFILNILQFEPQTLDGELGANLWAMLVGARATCVEDRQAGWSILNTVKQSSFQNPFLQTCLSEYLPALSPACFCVGMLDFVRSGILPRLNELGDLVLDDEELMAESGIEEVWRLVLEADDATLVEKSIQTLAIDIYIESKHISTNSLTRTRLIHLGLVDRCLRQLKEAARRIKAFSDGTSSDDDEPMVIVATDEQVQEQERIFTRTLKLLRFFLEAHQSKPLFSAPDLRTLISQTPCEVEGDSAGLKYQSFDGDNQTEVKPLTIGKLNTAASLLASIRQETGFDNYRVYYRGRPFLPSEHDICKSLEDLRVHDGLILVKREENGISPITPVKPGASPLEVEISAHFNEMWGYLSMEEMLAKEIYHFLIKLPTDGHVLKSIGSDSASYRDMFPPGQPYKSLYAVHALLQYTEAAFHGRVTLDADESDGENSRSQPISHTQAIKTAISLIVQALSDEDVVDRASLGLRLDLTTSLVHALVCLIDRLDAPRESLRVDEVKLPEPQRLVELLIAATTHPGLAPVPLIRVTLTAMIRLSYLDAEFCEKLVQIPDLTAILQKLLLTDTRVGIRTVAARMIEEGFVTGQVYMAEHSTRPLSTSLAQYYWSVVVDLVSQTASSPYQCEELFRLTHSLILKMMTRVREQPNILHLASRVSQLLLDHVSTENVGQIGLGDSFARGVTSLLHLCLQMDDSIASSPDLPVNLGPDLFWKHLYPKKRNETEQPVPKVIMNSETRAKLVDIIFSVARHDTHQVRVLVESLDGLVPFYSDDDDEPYLYELQYQFDRSKALRSPCGYVGLQNLSNTCYLNSLFTQLFMNTSFRRFILNSKVRHSGGTQELLFFTQKLFGYMQESYRRFVDPSSLVGSIKTYDDGPIDIHNQMDVDEFYSLLFDRWEGQLPNSIERKKLRSFYGGRLVQQVKSKECEHISERDEAFSAIQCDIKGKSTLEESLQAYVDGEIMEGENKYKCSTCDRHVDAVKRACLKDVPDNVIFHLKRFDFNLRTLQRSKINDYFSFPSRVNLRPYTIEYLSEPNDDGEEDIFELVGVLVHSGTAESGHYYSYIRERPSLGDRQSWVEFNDDLVTPWDPAMMESSTFGGPDHRPPYDANGVMYDKTYSAYMLFYQRASSLEAEQEAMLKSNVPVPLRVDVPENLKEHILDENTVILRRHCLFDPSHVRLVQLLFNQTRAIYDRSLSVMNLDEDSEETISMAVRDHQLQDAAMQMIVSNLDQVVTRTKDIPDFPAFSRVISEAILDCSQCAYAFFEYFYKRPEVLRAFLQRNPDTNIRLTVGKMFVWALEKMNTALPDLYGPKVSSPPGSDMDEDEDELTHVSEAHVIERTMHLLNHLWRYFHIHIKAWDEYFATILGFAKIGNREVSYLLAGDYLSRVIRIIAADSMMEMPPNYTRMLHNVVRRVNNTRPPSYLAIIALIHHLMLQLEPKLGVDVIVDDPTERLESKGVPFNWTAEEVELVHRGLDSNTSSLFVEKLIGIDQAYEHTDGILRLLIGLSPHMDSSILGTLKRCIRGETSTQVMDPFLRAASVYIEHTGQVDNATKMVHHIFLQAKSLQNSEGLYFVNFFKAALHLQRTETTFRTTVRAFSLKLVPKWAPWLLANIDGSTRAVTEDFLTRELFQNYITADTKDEEIFDPERRIEATQITKQVGIACLLYLQENHVRRRLQLRRAVANDFMQVLSQCVKVINSDPETQDSEDVEFLMLQRDVVDPVRRLLVDDVDDDGSGMLQSLGDSDTITANIS
ncbi:hypothetical protein BGZ63DRAFT_262203 [Mariannaea sp. PMI_226]|nr:hypothetical protein BGZ63DRAFT_262203 [Mariannaea sp. PMI_226]